MHNKHVNKLREYFYNKDAALHKTVIEADKKYTPLNMADRNAVFQIEINDEILHQWAQKAVHGGHFSDLHQEDVDIKASNKWLSNGDLYAETEGYLLAIQDRVLPTRNYKKYILNTPHTEDKCRRCGQNGETIEHILNVCSTLAPTKYTIRHDNVAKIVHQNLAVKHHLLEQKCPYFKYSPEAVLESNTHKLMWNRSIITDKAIQHNRPDIILTIKNEMITYLIDIAVPWNRNLSNTHNRKIQKYSELASEIKRVWRQREVHTIPVVLSSTGLIPKKLHKSLQSLGLQQYLYMELQKASILQTCHLVRNFLHHSQEAEEFWKTTISNSKFKVRAPREASSFIMQLELLRVSYPIVEQQLAGEVHFRLKR
ncbi:uncharacterized protein LOC132699669 [Cylas formicarius]|uniref:uncharacterized protein LOC132699669 n=1 Tax=Cylas formicarius TaxID=197179 RepID=UPI002958ACD9|nr:uncharacterized protein LOC132699669 [Cylas formicarius]